MAVGRMRIHPAQIHRAANQQRTIHRAANLQFTMYKASRSAACIVWVLLGTCSSAWGGLASTWLPARVRLLAGGCPPFKPSGMKQGERGGTCKRNTVQTIQKHPLPVAARNSTAAPAQRTRNQTTSFQARAALNHVLNPLCLPQANPEGVATSPAISRPLTDALAAAGKASYSELTAARWW